MVSRPTMNIRHARMMLWLLAAAALPAGVAALALAVTVPLDAPEPVVGGSAPARTAAAVVQPLELSQFKQWWSLPLRKSLVEPKQEAAAKPAAATVTLGMKLLGTMIEASDESRAVLTGRDGAVEIGHAGGWIEDGPERWRVVAVTDDAVTLERDGKRVTLEIEGAKGRRR
jgi:Tfp pilus assembly protein PilP